MKKYMFYICQLYLNLKNEKNKTLAGMQAKWKIADSLLLHNCVPVVSKRQDEVKDKNPKSNQFQFLLAPCSTQLS